jgi:hypothetical protein
MMSSTRFDKRALVAAAFVLAVGPAQATNDKHPVQNAPAPSTGVPIVGGGSYIQNKPNGYYIGRAMAGTHFGHAWSASTTTGNHHWGRAIHTVNMCGWVVPGSLSPAFEAWGNNCSQATADFLRCRRTIGRDFNGASHVGPYPGTWIGAGNCPHYKNYYYGTDFPYNGGNWKDYSGQTTAGGVYYRYTTPDGGARVVFDNNHGWGFVPSTCLGTSSPVYNDNDC